MDIAPIRHSVYIDASVDIVYRTLTTAEGWDAWFTDGTELDPSPNGEIVLRWRDFGPSRISAEDGGPILEAERNKRFVFEWEPGDNPTTVAFTFHAHAGGTILELEESGYETMTSYVDCATGWGEAMALLKFYLEHGVTYGEVPEEQEPI
ncbi:MAG: SRPBCC domain-containing protein [Armatimonadota bacterium]|nr:SRPBCC domain-containing protein [Armatimonadota bacterium]